MPPGAVTSPVPIEAYGRHLLPLQEEQFHGWFSRLYVFVNEAHEDSELSMAGALQPLLSNMLVVSSVSFNTLTDVFNDIQLVQTADCIYSCLGQMLTKCISENSNSPKDIVNSLSLKCNDIYHNTIVLSLAALHMLFAKMGFSSLTDKAGGASGMASLDKEVLFKLGDPGGLNMDSFKLVRTDLNETDEDLYKPVLHTSDVNLTSEDKDKGSTHYLYPVGGRVEGLQGGLKSLVPLLLRCLSIVSETELGLQEEHDIAPFVNVAQDLVMIYYFQDKTAFINASIESQASENVQNILQCLYKIASASPLVINSDTDDEKENDEIINNILIKMATTKTTKKILRELRRKEFIYSSTKFLFAQNILLELMYNQKNWFNFLDEQELLSFNYIKPLTDFIYRPFPIVGEKTGIVEHISNGLILSNVLNLLSLTKLMGSSCKYQSAAVSEHFSLQYFYLENPDKLAYSIYRFLKEDIKNIRIDKTETQNDIIKTLETISQHCKGETNRRIEDASGIDNGATDYRVDYLLSVQKILDGFMTKVIIDNKLSEFKYDITDFVFFNIMNLIDIPGLSSEYKNLFFKHYIEMNTLITLLKYNKDQSCITHIFRYLRLLINLTQFSSPELLDIINTNITSYFYDNINKQSNENIEHEDNINLLEKYSQLIDFALIICDKASPLVTRTFLTKDKIEYYMDIFRNSKQITENIIDENKFTLLTNLFNLMKVLLDDEQLKLLIINDLKEANAFELLIRDFYSLFLTYNPQNSDDPPAILCQTLVLFYCKALNLAIDNSQNNEEGTEIIDKLIGKYICMFDEAEYPIELFYFIGYIVPLTPAICEALLKSEFMENLFDFCLNSVSISKEEKDNNELSLNTASLLIISLVACVQLVREKKRNSIRRPASVFDYTQVKNRYNSLVKNRLIKFIESKCVEQGVLKENSIKLLLSLSAPRFNNETVPNILIPEIIELLLSKSLNLNKQIDEARTKGKLTDMVCRRIDRQQKFNWLEPLLKYIKYNKYNTIILAQSQVPNIILESLKPAFYNSSLFNNSSLVAVTLLKYLIPHVTKSFLNSLKIIVADPLIYESLDNLAIDNDIPKEVEEKNTDDNNSNNRTNSNNNNNNNTNDSQMKPELFSNTSSNNIQSLPMPLKLLEEGFSLLSRSISPIQLTPYSNAEYGTTGLLTYCQFRNDQSISFAGWFSVSIPEDSLNMKQQQSLGNLEDNDDNVSGSILKRIRLVTFQAVDKDVGFSIYYNLTKNGEEMVEVEGNNFSSVSAPIVRINQTGVNLFKNSGYNNSSGMKKTPLTNKSSYSQFFHIALNISSRILRRPEYIYVRNEIIRPDGLELYVNGRKMIYQQTISATVQQFEFSKFWEHTLDSFPREYKDGTLISLPDRLNSQYKTDSTTIDPYFVLIGGTYGDTIKEEQLATGNENTTISVGTTFIAGGTLKPVNVFALSCLGATDKIPIYSSFSGASNDDKFPIIYTRWGDVLPSRDESIAKKLIVDRVVEILQLEQSVFYSNPQNASEQQIIENPIFSPIRDIMPAGINMNILLETKTFSNPKAIYNFFNSSEGSSVQNMVNNAFPYNYDLQDSSGSTCPLVFGVQSMNSSSINPPLCSRTGYDNILYAITYGLVDLESSVELDSTAIYCPDTYDKSFIKILDKDENVVMVNSNSLGKDAAKMYKCVASGNNSVCIHYPVFEPPEFTHFLELIRILTVIISNLDKSHSSWLSTLVAICLTPLKLQTNKITKEFNKCQDYVLNILVSLYKYMVKNNIITLPLDVLNQLYHIVFPLDNMELLSVLGISSHDGSVTRVFNNYLQPETVGYRYYNLVFNRFFFGLRFGNKDIIKYIDSKKVIEAIQTVTSLISKVRSPTNSPQQMVQVQQNIANTDTEMCPILYGLATINILLSEQPFLINVPTAGIISVMRRDGTLPILLGLLDDMVNVPISPDPLDIDKAEISTDDDDNDNDNNNNVSYKIKPIDIPSFHLTPIAELIISIILQLELTDLKRSELNMMNDIIRHVIAEFKTNCNYNFHRIILQSEKDEEKVRELTRRSLIFKPLELIPSISLAIALLLFYNILIDVYIDLMQQINRNNEEMKNVISTVERHMKNPYDLASPQPIDPQYPEIVKHFMTMFIQNIQTNESYLRTFKKISKNIITSRAQELKDEEKKGLNLGKLINRMTSKVINVQSFSTFTDSCFEIIYQLIPEIIHFTFKTKALINRSEYDKWSKYKLRSIDMLFDFGHRLHTIANLLHIKKHSGIEFNFGSYVNCLFTNNDIKTSGSTIGLIPTFIDLQYNSKMKLLDINTILHWYEMFNSEYLDEIIGSVSLSEQDATHSIPIIENNNNDHNEYEENMNIDDKINQLIVGGGLGKVPDLILSPDSTAVSTLLENLILQSKNVYDIFKMMSCLKPDEGTERLKNEYYIYPFVVIFIILDYFNLSKAKNLANINAHVLDTNQRQQQQEVTEDKRKRRIDGKDSSGPFGSKGKLGILDYCLADTNYAKGFCEQDTVLMNFFDNRYDASKGTKYSPTKTSKFDDGKALKPYHRGLFSAQVQSALILGKIIMELERDSANNESIPRFYTELMTYLNMSINLSLLSNIESIIDWYLFKLLQKPIPSQSDKAQANAALNALKGMLYQIVEHSSPPGVKLRLLISIFDKLVMFLQVRQDSVKNDLFCDLFDSLLKTIINIYGDTQITPELLLAAKNSSNKTISPTLTNPNGSFLENIQMSTNTMQSSGDAAINVTDSMIDCNPEIEEIIKRFNSLLSSDISLRLRSDDAALLMLCSRRLIMIHRRAISVQRSRCIANDAIVRALNSVPEKKDEAHAHIMEGEVDESQSGDEGDSEEHKGNNNDKNERIDDDILNLLISDDSPLLRVPAKTLIDISNKIHPCALIPDINLLKKTDVKLFDEEIVKTIVSNKFTISKQLEKKTKLSSSEKQIAPYIANTLVQLFNRDSIIDKTACYIFIALIVYEPNVLISVLYDSIMPQNRRSFTLVEKLINSILSIFAKLYEPAMKTEEDLRKEMNMNFTLNQLDLLGTLSSSLPTETTYIVQRNKIKASPNQNLSNKKLIEVKVNKIKKFESKNKVPLIYLNAIRRSSKLRGRGICYVMSLRNEDVLKSFNISSAKWLKDMADSFKMSEESVELSEDSIRDSDVIPYKRSPFKSGNQTLPFLIENRDIFRNYRGEEKYESSTKHTRLVNFSKYITGVEENLIEVYREKDNDVKEAGENGDKTVTMITPEQDKELSKGEIYGFLVNCNDSTSNAFYSQFVRRITYYYIKDAMDITPYEKERLMIKDLTPPGMLPYMAMNVDMAVGTSQRQPSLCLVSDDEVTFASHVNMIPIDIKDGIERLLSEKYSSENRKITVVFERPMKTISKVSSEDLSSVLGILGTTANMSSSTEMINGKNSQNSVSKFGDIQSPSIGSSNTHGSDWVYSVIPPDWSIVARAKESAFGAYNSAETNMAPYTMHRSFIDSVDMYGNISFKPEEQYLEYYYNNKMDTMLPQYSIHNVAKTNKVVILGTRELKSEVPSPESKTSRIVSPKNENVENVMRSSTLNQLQMANYTPVSTDGSLLFYPFNIPEIAFQYVYAPFSIENIFGVKSRQIEENKEKLVAVKNIRETIANEEENMDIINEQTLIRILKDMPVSISVGNQQGISLTVNGKPISTVLDVKNSYLGIDKFLSNLRRIYGDVRVSHIASSSLVNLKRINMQHRPTGIEIGLNTPYVSSLYRIDKKQSVPIDREDAIFKRLAFDSEACNTFKTNGETEIILNIPDKYNSNNELLQAFIRRCIESLSSAGEEKTHAKPFAYRSYQYDIPGYVARELLFAFLTKASSRVKTGLISSSFGKSQDSMMMASKLVNPISLEGQNTKDISTLLETSLPNIEYTSNVALLKAIITKTGFSISSPNFSSTIPSQVTVLYVLSHLYFGTPDLLFSLNKDLEYIHGLIYPNNNSSQPVEERYIMPIRLVNKGVHNGEFGARSLVDSWKGELASKFTEEQTAEISTAISLQRLWACGLLTTFEFINHLNTLSSRYSSCSGFGDPTTSSIFPWVIHDFRTEKILDIIKRLQGKKLKTNSENNNNNNNINLDGNKGSINTISLKDSPLLRDHISFIKRKIDSGGGSKKNLYISEESRYRKVFRDFRYPLGAQTEAEREKLSIKFEFSHDQYIQSLRYKNKNKQQMPPFHYGTFFSTPSANQLYMLPLSPNIENHLALQSFHYDYADRQYTTVMKYGMVKNNTSKFVPLINPNDNAEYISEIYYFDFLLRNPYNNGVRYNRDRWVESDMRDASGNIIRETNGLFKLLPFILESVYVKKNLMEWIDLIYGRDINTGFFSANKEEELMKNRAIAKYNTYFYNAYPLPNIDTLFENSILQRATDSSQEISMQTNMIQDKSQVMKQREFFGSSPKQLFTVEDYNKLNTSYLYNIKTDVIKSVSLTENISCGNIYFNKESIVGETPIRAVCVDDSFRLDQLHQLYSRGSCGEFVDTYDVMNVLGNIINSDMNVYVDNSEPFKEGSKVILIQCSDMMLSFELIGDGYVKISSVERRVLSDTMTYMSTRTINNNNNNNNNGNDADIFNLDTSGPGSLFSSDALIMGTLSGAESSGAFVDSNLFSENMSQVSTTSTKTLGIFYLGCDDYPLGNSVPPIKLVGGNVLMVNCKDGTVRFFSLRTNKDVDLSNKRSLGMHDSNVNNLAKGFIPKTKNRIKKGIASKTTKLIDSHSFMNMISSLGVNSLDTISRMHRKKPEKKNTIDLLQLDIPLSPMEIMTKTTSTKTYVKNMRQTVSVLCTDILPLSAVKSTDATPDRLKDTNNTLFVRDIGSIPPRFGPYGEVKPVSMDYNNAADMAVVLYNDGTLLYLVNNNVIKITSLLYLLRHNKIESSLVFGEGNNSKGHRISVRSMSLFDDCNLLISFKDSSDKNRLKALLITPSNIVEAVWSVDLCGQEGLIRKSLRAGEEIEGDMEIVDNEVILTPKQPYYSIIEAINVSYDNGTKSALVFVELEILNLDGGWVSAPGTYSDVKMRRLLRLPEQHGMVTTMSYNALTPWLLLVGTTRGRVLGLTLPPPVDIQQRDNTSCGICGSHGFDITKELKYDDTEHAGYNIENGIPLLRVVAPHRGVYNGILMCSHCMENIERERLGLRPLMLEDDIEEIIESVSISENNENVEVIVTPQPSVIGSGAATTYDNNNRDGISMETYPPFISADYSDKEIKQSGDDDDGVLKITEPAIQSITLAQVNMEDEREEEETPEYEEENPAK